MVGSLYGAHLRVIYGVIFIYILHSGDKTFVAQCRLNFPFMKAIYNMCIIYIRIYRFTEIPIPVAMNPHQKRNFVYRVAGFFFLPQGGNGISLSYTHTLPFNYGCRGGVCRRPGSRDVRQSHLCCRHCRSFRNKSLGVDKVRHGARQST